MRILTRADVQKLISMHEVIGLMEEVFVALTRGEAVVPERTLLTVANPENSILYMPAYLPKKSGLGIKVVSFFPTNAERGIPTINAQVLLNDQMTGEVIAIVEAGYITSLRTGATSALATKYLANDDARNLGVFGAGVQARTQIAAIVEVRHIETVRIYSPVRHEALMLAQEIQATKGCHCTVADNPDDVVLQSDIIVTATTSLTPVFDGKLLKDGTHINSIGSFKPHIREVDDETVKRSVIFVDSRVHALKEAGDLLIPIQNGCITRDDIRGELGELILGKVKGRGGREDITLFKSVGIAVQDIAIAQAVHQRAEERNIGVVL